MFAGIGVYAPFLRDVAAPFVGIGHERTLEVRVGGDQCSAHPRCVVDAVLAIGAVAALIDSFLDIRGRIRGIDASPASHPTVLLQMIGLDERGHRPG